MEQECYINKQKQPEMREIFMENVLKLIKSTSTRWFYGRRCELIITGSETET